MRLRAGDRVLGLEILGMLGEGATSEVYLVRERDTDTLRALKLLSVHGRSHRQRMQIEGEALADLRHPNVVGVLRMVDYEGWLGVLMEYVRGPTLHRWLDVETAELPDALVLLDGILGGVAALHEQGLVHRDLKPGNVLLDVQDDGVRPRLADFGLVKQLMSERRQTMTGASMGTPAYMPPEQLRDASRVDGRADLYAVGCILYEMLVGEPPFRRDDWWETWKAIEEGQRADLARLPPETPAAVRGVIGRLLEPEPDDRPASVAEVRAMLDPSATPHPPAAPPPMPLTSDGGLRAHRLAHELDAAARSTEGPLEAPAMSPTTLGEADLQALSALWEDDAEAAAAVLDDDPVEAPPRRRRIVWVVPALVGLAVLLFGGGLLLGGLGGLQRGPSPAPATLAGVSGGDASAVSGTPDEAPDPAPEGGGGEPGDTAEEPPTPAEPASTPSSEPAPVAARPEPPPAGEPTPPAAPPQATPSAVIDKDPWGADGSAEADPSAPEPAADGSFSVAGDASEVVVVGPDGTRYDAGMPVPPGRYRILVRWSETQRPAGAGEVRIGPGEQVQLTCRSAFLRCRT